MYVILQVTLRDLSLRLIRQSYKLTAETYDKPEGCMIALQVLVGAIEKPSSRIQALEMMSNLITSDAVACTRYLLISTETVASNFIKVDIPKPLFVKCGF